METTQTATEKCFACDRKLGKSPKLVDTRDDQIVYVGSECFKLIVAAGESGYQPKGGGPRLYPLTVEQESCVCTQVCDCQNPEPKDLDNDVAHCSQECPIHNWNQDPHPECQATEHWWQR